MVTQGPNAGIIRNDETYKWPVFLQLAGLGQKAGRAAVRRGLRVLKSGKCKYVRGSDWAAYLERTNRNEVAAAQ